MDRLMIRIRAGVIVQQGPANQPSSDPPVAPAHGVDGEEFPPCEDTTDTPEVYKWAKQAEVLKATNQVLGPGELNKGVLCKAIQNQEIKNNDKSGRASRVKTESFLVWIQRREKLQNDEVLQIRNAIIGEISNRKPSRN
jgi:hypothetical protein